MILQLTESFYGREDVSLTPKLFGELPGILNWALEGLRALHQQGHFIQPTGSIEVMEMMRFAASPILKFIDDRLAVGEDLTDNRDAVYTAYKEWCAANEHHPMSKTKFDMALNSALPSVTLGRPGTRGEDRERIYRGICRLKGVDNVVRLPQFA